MCSVWRDHPQQHVISVGGGAGAIGPHPHFLLKKITPNTYSIIKEVSMPRLTSEQVEELVRLRVEENKTQVELSEIFNITQPAVWRHLKKRGLTKKQRAREEEVTVPDVQEGSTVVPLEEGGQDGE